MKKYGIKVPRRKIKNNFCTKSVKHRKYPNLIKDLEITYENQVWCSDTSRFIFHGNKWYIVTVIDIFTRQVLGVAIGRHHDSTLVLEAIEMALVTSQTAPEIFHSDQGTEFMADACTDFLEKLKTRISASDKASPWQNGYQESFFGKFKDDVGDVNRFETPGELLETLYHAIHYYNNERIHTALKMPPVVFAKQFLKKWFFDCSCGTSWTRSGYEANRLIFKHVKPDPSQLGRPNPAQRGQLHKNSRRTHNFLHFKVK